MVQEPGAPRPDAPPVAITIDGGEATPVRFTFDETANVWVDLDGQQVTPGEMLLLLNDVCFGVFERPLDETWRRWRPKRPRRWWRGR